MEFSPLYGGDGCQIEKQFSSMNAKTCSLSANRLNGDVMGSRQGI